MEELKTITPKTFEQITHRWDDEGTSYLKANEVKDLEAVNTRGFNVQTHTQLLGERSACLSLLESILTI